jgi:hypothetical protein
VPGGHGDDVILSLKRKRVRVHFNDGKPSLEGFFLGRMNGHYHLAKAEVIESPDRTVELDSREVAIPREQVWFYEVLR